MTYLEKLEKLIITYPQIKRMIQDNFYNRSTYHGNIIIDGYNLITNATANTATHKSVYFNLKITECNEVKILLFDRIYKHDGSMRLSGEYVIGDEIINPEIIEDVCKSLLKEHSEEFQSRLEMDWKKQLLHDFAKQKGMEYMLNEDHLTDDELVVKDILE